MNMDRCCDSQLVVVTGRDPWEAVFLLSLRSIDRELPYRRIGGVVIRDLTL